MLAGSLSTLAFFVACLAQAQLPYTEEFTDNAFEDAGRTTADWNNSSGTGVAGQVVLPTGTALTGPLFNNTSTAIGPAAITRGIAVGDFNGDGFPDFVEGNSGSGNNVFLNNGTGVFNLAYSTPDTFSTTRSVAVGDVDGDGDLDWVEGNFGSDPPRVYLNDGTGTGFVVQNIRSAARSIDDIALVDVNQDGFPDVILASDIGTERNLLILNTTDPIFPFGPNGTPGSDLPGLSVDESKEILAGDLDNDGDIDLVMLNEGVNRVHMNTGAGFTDSQLNDPFDPQGYQNSHGGALGDLNGDGWLDLVVIDFLNNEISNIYINNGSGAADANPFTLAPVELPGGAGGPEFEQNASLADADNDGDLDIYVAVAGESETNRIYVNDGTGTTYSVILLGVNATVSNDGVAVDTDGDGDIDFLTGTQELDINLNSIPGNNELYVNLGSANPPGAAALQLNAFATSLPVNGVSGINANGVRLDATEVSTGLTLHNDIQYWISNDNGVNWVRALPGRPVNFSTAGTQLVWRAFLRSESPFNAGILGLDQLVLENNAAAPLCDDNTNVTETEDTPITPIVANCPDADGDTVYYSMSGLPASSGLSFNVATRTLSGTPNNFDTAASPITLTFTGSDGAAQGTDMLVLTVSNTNDAPQFDSIPAGFISAGPPVTAGATPGVLYSYTIMTSDIDPGETLTITAPTLPSWVTTFTDNGDGTALLEGTPSVADVANNNHAVALVVTDSAMATATQDYEIIVDNNPPGFTSPAVIDATEGLLYEYFITASDPDLGDTLTITATGPGGGALAGWLTLTATGNGMATLSGTPGQLDVGTFDVELTVTDANGETGTQNFTITVMNVNDAPSFTSTPPAGNAQQGLTYTYNITASDPDPGAMLTITAPTRPGWLSFVDNGDGTATLTGTPGNPEVGDHNVVLELSDGIAAPIQQPFTITVDDVNEAPSITSTAVTGGTQGIGYAYNVTATDPDVGDVLAITAPTLPGWLTLTDNGNGTATLSGTPGPGDTGDNDVVLTVTDAGNLTDSQSFTIAIVNINDAPTFTSMPITGVTEAVEYLYNISTNDADGDAVTITALTLPGWLTLTDNGDGTAQLRGTPTGTEVGDHQVVLSAQDPSMASNTQTFAVTVNAVDEGPVITITGDNPVTVSLGSTYTDEGATASDPQDGDLTGSIVTDNPVNTAVADTYFVTYSVTDSAMNTVQAQRTVIVPNNQAPVLDTAIGDQTRRAGDTININAATNVSDPDGDSLTFAATGLPASLSISAAGAITGTLTAGDVTNSPYDITVTATDTGGLSVSASFRLTVNAALPPPSSGGGGGSTGLLELLGMLMLAAGSGAMRRRRPANPA